MENNAEKHKFKNLYRDLKQALAVLYYDTRQGISSFWGFVNEIYNTSSGKRKLEQRIEERDRDIGAGEDEISSLKEEKDYLASRVARIRYREETRKKRASRAVMAFKELHAELERVVDEYALKLENAEKKEKDYLLKIAWLSQFNKQLAEDWLGVFLEHARHVYSKDSCIIVGKNKCIIEASDLVLSLLKGPAPGEYDGKTRERSEEEKLGIKRNLVVGIPYTKFLAKGEKEKIRVLEKEFIHGKREETYLKDIKLNLEGEIVKSDIIVVPIIGPSTSSLKKRINYAGFVLLIDPKTPSYAKRVQRKLAKVRVETKKWLALSSEFLEKFADKKAEELGEFWAALKKKRLRPEYG